MKHVDLIVVGSGPGGYVCALKAAQLGAKVMLAEKRDLGGTCLNRGCIPTKALHKSAQLYDQMEKMSEFGIETGEIYLNYRRVFDRKTQIVDHMTGSVEELLSSAGVEIVKGRCDITSNNEANITLEDGDRFQVKADRMVLATGSQPKISTDLPGHDLENVVGTDDILNMTELVDDLVVIGGGVTGVELAGIQAQFGVNVTLIKRTPHISPIDSNIVKRLFTTLKKQGINVMTKTQVKEIKEAEDGKLIVVVDKKGKTEELTADKVLISRGREPHIDGVDALDLDIDKDGIVVNDKMETNIPGIYAIGDAANKGAMLAHVATHQGVIAAKNALGENESYDDKAVPNCVFTVTEVASVGYSEDELKEQEIPYQVGRFTFQANGKALVEGDTGGMVKILSHQTTDQVLGVHIMGPHASDLIQEGTVAVKSGLTSRELADTIHPHPTLSESVWEAALDVTDIPIHQIQKKR